jgi:hypothetical protein
MSDEQFIAGWAKLADGSRIAISEQDARAMMAQVEANEARKAAAMPTTKEAVSALFDAYDRLRQLGWSEGSYCPKDGSPFAAIQRGSTGIFTGFFDGEWPYDFAHIENAGTHPHGFMWKPLDKLTEWEEAARQKSAQSTSQFIERLGRVATRLPIAAD